VALLELHVDVGESLADALAERDEAVIRAEGEETRITRTPITIQPDDMILTPDETTRRTA
jgi:hypothetical protein